MEKIKIMKLANANLKNNNNKELFEQMSDSEFALHQDMVEWLLKPIDVDIKVRDKNDEVWKDKVVK